VKCPYCHHPESKVLDSRPTDDGASIRRRRECQLCDRRFTTYEKVEEVPLMVVKKDGRREAFDRAKILGGLLKACEKRPVPVATLEQAVDEIERDVRNTLEREIPTETVGEMVMEKLRGIDEVAYVRFASVYRQFKDLNKFREELERLLAGK
jgi:transcriptional repressor NrdR